MERFKATTYPVDTIGGVQVLKQPKRRKIETKGENTTPLVPIAENENLQKIYHFGISKRNENYLAGLVPVKVARKPKTNKSLRSCQLLNNAENNRQVFIVKTQPKWNTEIQVSGLDTTTGEFIPNVETYQTNDLKAGNNRKIVAAKNFCEIYSPQLKKRSVSAILHTFTQLDLAGKDMRSMIDIVKCRYKSIGRKLKGYFWVLEISSPDKQKNLSGFHLHYHLVVIVDRLNIKGGKMPNALKLNDAWGQRTQVEFIKSSLEGLLIGYLGKNNYRLTDTQGKKIRMFGNSRRYE
jgi:hypothetical protein